MIRISSERFDFDYKYYNGLWHRMLHIKIYTNGPSQTDLWLDEDDRKALKKVLESDN